MAGVRITLAYEHDEALRALRYLRNLGEDPEPLLDIMGSTLLASTERRFDEGRGPGGIPWPQSRRAARDGGKTLVNRGDLVDSLRYEATSRDVEIGVDGTSQSSKFAYVHHYGATIRPVRAKALAFMGANGHLVFFAESVTIPARPFLGIDADDRQAIAEDWHDYVRSRLG